MITEETLIKLGFEYNFVSVEESGANEYYYYTLDLGNGECLMSNANDELNEQDGYTVSLFNTADLGHCDTEDEIRILYKALTKNTL